MDEIMDDSFPIAEDDLGTCSQLNIMRGWPDDDSSLEDQSEPWVDASSEAGGSWDGKG